MQSLFLDIVNDLKCFTLFFAPNETMKCTRVPCNFMVIGCIGLIITISVLEINTFEKKIVLIAHQQPTFPLQCSHNGKK